LDSRVESVQPIIAKLCMDESRAMLCSGRDDLKLGSCFLQLLFSNTFILYFSFSPCFLATAIPR